MLSFESTLELDAAAFVLVVDPGELVLAMIGRREDGTAEVRREDAAVAALAFLVG